MIYNPNARYIATFRPQAWIRDNAVEVDPDGETQWDCTEFIAAASPEWREATLSRGKDYDDILREDPAAPEWVRNWRGPFDTWVEEVT